MSEGVEGNLSEEAPIENQEYQTSSTQKQQSEEVFNESNSSQMNETYDSARSESTNENETTENNGGNKLSQGGAADGKSSKPDYLTSYSKDNDDLTLSDEVDSGDAENNEDDLSYEEDDNTEGGDNANEFRSSNDVDDMLEKQSIKKLDKKSEITELVNQILTLDCESESPILTSFWLSQLSTLPNPSQNMITKSFATVFSEFRHFLSEFDFSLDSIQIHGCIIKLDILLTDLQIQNTKYFDIFPQLENLTYRLNRLKFPMSRISQIQPTIEIIRSIKQFIDVNFPQNEKEKEIAETFDIIYNILIPISHLLFTIDKLNQYLSSHKFMHLDQLSLHIPNFHTPEITPYEPTSFNKHTINENLNEYIYSIALEINNSGVKIFSDVPKDNFNVDELIIPNISPILLQIFEAINNVFPENYDIVNFVSNIHDKIVSCDSIVTIIKKLKICLSERSITVSEIDRVNQAQNLLYSLTRLHHLYTALEIAGLMSYSKAIHLTYLRVFALTLSGEDIIESQSLLSPVNVRLLIDARRLTQRKLQGDMLQQRVALLNRLKLSLAQLFSAAFVCTDAAEYADIYQWIVVLEKINQMPDVEGVDQIKPLCLHLPKISEQKFPQLADDLWHLVDTPPLTETEKYAIDHIQAIFSAEFNGAPATEAFSNLLEFRIEAYCRDYTRILYQAVEFGFAKIDDDYELGLYGGGFSRRFIEHHWRINLLQVDPFFNELCECLPPRSQETDDLHSELFAIKQGGLCLDSLIKFGKFALACRHLFANPSKFTEMFSRLHTLVTFLELHDRIAQLISEGTMSPLIAFSMTRTFNFLRFVKYITALVMLVNNAGLITGEAGKTLFMQTLLLRRRAAAMKPTMELTADALDVLQHTLAAISATFMQGAVHADVVFERARLCLSVVSGADPDFAADVSALIDNAEAASASQSIPDLKASCLAIEDMLKGRRETLKPILSSLQLLGAVAQLRSVVDVAESFIENSGFNAIHYGDVQDMISVETISHSGPARLAYTVPRPQIVIPSTQLSHEMQNVIAAIFERMQTERNSITKDVSRYYELDDQQQQYQKELAALLKQREAILEDFKRLKETAQKSSHVTAAEVDVSRVEDPEQAAGVITRLRAILESQTEAMFSESQEMLRKNEALVSVVLEHMNPPEIAQSPAAARRGSAEESDAESDIFEGIDFDGINPQLVEVFKSIGIKKDL